MPDISKVTLSDGTTYNIKDAVARREPLETHTYDDVIATADSDRYGAFFYMKLRANSFRERWHVVLRIRATVPGTAENADLFNSDIIFELWGYGNTYGGYHSRNHLTSTSYRPIYYNSVFFVSSTGYTNGCGNWIGVNLHSSTNALSTDYKRHLVIDLLEYDQCEIEFSDTLYTPDTIPNRSTNTKWYTSTNTSFTNFNAYDQGTKMSGDANTNTTTIHALYRYYGSFYVDSAVYRYQMLFHTDENTLTPLNNDSNKTGTTKTMLTNVEFDPFMPIYYYGTTTAISAGNQIGAGSLYWHYSGVDLRYTLNCGSTLQAQQPFYLVVTPTSNGKCKLASTTPWSQSLPETADGNWYIYLGRTYSDHQITLYDDHPIYEYNGTGIARVLPIAAITNAEIDAIVGS